MCWPCQCRIVQQQFWIYQENQLQFQSVSSALSTSGVRLSGGLSDFGSCHKTYRVKWLRRKCCKKVVFSQNIVQIPSGSLNSATRDGRINCGGNVPMFKLKPSPVPGVFSESLKYPSESEQHISLINFTNEKQSYARYV